MGPKKGRPRKNNLANDVAESGNKTVDPPTVAPKAQRGRPAKKKPVIASSSPLDPSLPSIENVPVVRKTTTRGRGRKRLQLTRDVLCSSNTTEMQLRSQAKEFESAAEGNKNSQIQSSNVESANDALNCNTVDEQCNANSSVSDLSDEVEDKSNKENSFNDHPMPQKADSKQAKDVQAQTIESNPPLQEEASTSAMPFSPGDVPLKKRRLRELVMRDQEGFLIPSTMNAFASPTSSASSTPLLDLQPETAKRIIGAHVLYSGGFEQAVYVAKSCEFEAIGMFVKDLKKWVETTEVTEEESATFQKVLKECGILNSSVIARGSYIINICSSNICIHQASIDCIIDDMKRCSALSINNYTIQLGEFDSFHTRKSCIEKVAVTLNFIHRLTTSVVTVLENTCGEANTIGSNVDDFKEIFDGIEDKSRIGFAVDTCHLYSSGINITKREMFETFIQEFQDKIGLQHLKVIYANDSQGDLNSHVDHHLSIGEGKMGLNFFELLVNNPELYKIPLILETPISKHQADLKTLLNLVH